MLGLIVAILCSVICVLVHFILAHLGVAKENYEHPIRKLLWHGKILTIIWMAILPIFFILYNILYKIKNINTQSENFIYFIYGIGFFEMLFFLYLTIYYVVDRSVSSRIMIEIETSPEKKLTFDDLRKVYNADTKYENELKGMCQGGFSRKEGEFYSNTLKGSMVAKIAGSYKKIFRLGKGG